MYKTEVQIRGAIEAAVTMDLRCYDAVLDQLVECLTEEVVAPEDYVETSLTVLQRAHCGLVVRLVKNGVLSVEDAVLLFPQG